jgi:hypothetical protein
MRRAVGQRPFTAQLPDSQRPWEMAAAVVLELTSSRTASRSASACSAGFLMGQGTRLNRWNELR